MGSPLHMIIIDSLSKIIIFDIGPGDIGADQKLVINFLFGLKVSISAISPRKSWVAVTFAAFCGWVERWLAGAPERDKNCNDPEPTGIGYRRSA